MYNVFLNKIIYIYTSPIFHAGILIKTIYLQGSIEKYLTLLPSTKRVVYRKNVFYT